MTRTTTISDGKIKDAVASVAPLPIGHPFEDGVASRLRPRVRLIARSNRMQQQAARMVLRPNGRTSLAGRRLTCNRKKKDNR